MHCSAAQIPILQEEEEVNKRLQEKAFVKKLQDKVEMVRSLVPAVFGAVSRSHLKLKVLCLAVYV